MNAFAFTTCIYTQFDDKLSPFTSFKVNIFSTSIKRQTKAAKKKAIRWSKCESRSSFRHIWHLRQIGKAQICISHINCCDERNYSYYGNLRNCILIVWRNLWTSRSTLSLSLPLHEWERVHLLRTSNFILFHFLLRSFAKPKSHGLIFFIFTLDSQKERCWWNIELNDGGRTRKPLKENPKSKFNRDVFLHRFIVNLALSLTPHQVNEHSKRLW